MKKNKLIWMLGIVVLITSCDVDNELPEIVDETETTEVVSLDNGSADFSKYVAIGASFTAGVTDGTLFKASQKNSFPNILASKFALVEGGDFNQPLINDNIGGLLYNGAQIQEPRFYFDGSGPARIADVPTTEATTSIAGNYNNYGIPGAKSFHLVAPNYAYANPYFGRMTTSTTNTVLDEALAQNEDITFFTLSEIGGNDVLGYALAGGTGEDQTGNADATTYGSTDITDPVLFDTVLKNMVNALTANGAKGVIANVPSITSLANFTTVPYNPLDPTEEEDGNLTETAAQLASQIPLLNSIFGAVNQVYTGAGEPERSIVFSADATNPLVIYDENVTNLSIAITTALASDTNTFTPFVESLGLPAAAAPLVAQLIGNQYGKARSATENDLFVLASSTSIGEINTDSVAALITLSGGLLSETLAAQFSSEGITLPLADKWVLTPEEQESIRIATDAYNTSIEAVAVNNTNLILVDLNSLLSEAALVGLDFDNYLLNTDLVTGGLISLDGIHLTSRGYALMANKILEAIDKGFGSNFTEATNGLAKADDYPTNYSVTFR